MDKESDYLRMSDCGRNVWQTDWKLCSSLVLLPCVQYCIYACLRGCQDEYQF